MAGRSEKLRCIVGVPECWCTIPGRDADLPRSSECTNMRFAKYYGKQKKLGVARCWCVIVDEISSLNLSDIVLCVEANTSIALIMYGLQAETAPVKCEPCVIHKVVKMP